MKTKDGEELDDRVLKQTFGQTHEEYSFCIIYESEGELYGMYVWGESYHEASEEFLKRVPGAKIKEVKRSWPR